MTEGQMHSLDLLRKNRSEKNYFPTTYLSANVL